MKPVFSNPYVLAIISGILCVLSFPPFNFSFLIWFSIVPLLYALIITPYEKKTYFRITYYEAPLIGALFGVVFYFSTLHWIYNVLGISGLLLLLVLYAYPYIFAYGFNYIYSKVKTGWSILILPAFLWVAVEYIKSEGWWLKFSWMNLGYTQHNFLPVLQFANILGQYGLTALILLVNSVIVYILLNFHNKKKVLASIIYLFAITTVVLSYGFIQLEKDYSPNIKVALIQDESSDYSVYAKLISKIDEKVDFILLPEYSLPTYLEEDTELLSSIKNITLTHNSYFIAGSKSKNIGDGKHGYYNTVFLLGPSGVIEGKYYKMNPIQFFNDGDPGKDYSVFQTQHGKAGIFICYDMDYSYVARNIVKNGAELLFVPTYDAMRWGELQHKQHSAMTSMRAVENGRFIARTATSGVSQIIEPTGKITKSIPIGESDIAIGSIMPIKSNTFYTGYGFILPYVAIIISIITLFSAIFYKKQRPASTTK